MNRCCLAVNSPRDAGGRRKGNGGQGDGEDTDKLAVNRVAGKAEGCSVFGEQTEEVA